MVYHATEHQKQTGVDGIDAEAAHGELKEQRRRTGDDRERAAERMITTTNITDVSIKKHFWATFSSPAVQPQAQPIQIFTNIPWFDFRDMQYELHDILLRNRLFPCLKSQSLQSPSMTRMPNNQLK